MAENNTTGAVHLTELSLDLTQFNENIRQIEQATAQVADVSVQNLSKIRDALNISGEQIKISADTQQFKQDIDEAANAVSGLSENTQRATSDMGSMFSGLLAIVEKIASEISGSNINIPEISQITEEINRLRERIVEEGNALSSNSKTVEESSNAYRVLLGDVTSLSQKWGQIGTTIKQSTSSVTADAEQIKRLALQYANFANTIQRSKISEDTGMKDLANQVKATEQSLKDLVTDLAKGNVTVEEAGEEYRRLTSRLVELKTQFADTGYEQEKLLQSADLADSLANRYDTLQQKAARLATAMSNFRVKFDSPELANLITQTEQLGTKAGEAANDLRTLNTANEQNEAAFNRLTQDLKDMSLSFEQVKQSSADYKNSLKPIQQQAQETATALKALEKSAQFKTQKQEIANLRSEYDNFINRLKTAGMSAEEAKSQLADLDARFQSLQGSVNTSNTVLGRFAARLGETIKWRIAHSAITLLMQSFGNLTSTITGTEDAIIELRRVLGDTGISDSSMAQGLYDIAYTYGQVFDTVQEVAVKFAQTGMEWDEVLEATRATMLGLNTAELEVSTATEGLIAVMAQFNIEASDLETVIDKINITADNFPVTSEKIVAALQRAGGTASAFNMTLEETIATITALAEKTGRTGENIGTALNSLIIFTSKESNLKLFSSLSTEMDTTVKKFKSGSGSIIDIWTQLSKEIENMSKKQADALFNSTDFEEFADKFEAEAAEYASSIQQIYGTAGAYRRNYLTVLLQDMETVEDVMRNMTDAIGYSAIENETAMEAFSKQWNQLVVSAKELAVQFGESGFLDLMKVLVQVADYVLRVTKNLGGLNTVLVVTGTLIAIIKAEQIEKRLSNLSNMFPTITGVVQAYNDALAMGYGRMQAFTTAMSTMKITVSGVVTAIGLLTAAIGMYITHVKEAEAKAKQAREEAMKAGKEATESAEGLAKAYSEYNNVLKDSTATMEEVESARQSMLNLLGLEKNANDELIKKNGEIVGSYEEVDKWIKQLTEDEYAHLKAQAEIALANAEANISKAEGTTKSAVEIGAGGSTLFGSQPMSTAYFNMLKEAPELLERIQKVLYSRPTKETLSDDINTLNEGIKYLQENEDSATRSTDLLYIAIEELYGVYSVLNDEWQAAKDNVDKFADEVENMAVATEDAADSTEKLSISLADLNNDIEKIADIMETLNGKVDEFQSAYQTLIGVIDEYNETGIMTADMLQSLLELEPEYIELLDIKGDSISIDDEKLQNLIATNDDYLNQLVALKAAEEADALMKDAQAAAALGLTLQEYQLMDATDNLNLKTYALVKQFYDGELSAGAFRTELANLAEQAGITGSNLQYLVDSMSDVVNMYGALYTASSGTQQAITRANTAAGSIKRYYTPSSSSRKSSGGSSSSKQEDPFKAQKEALDEMLDAYEHAVKLIEVDNKKIFDSDKLKVNAEEIVAIYTQMQAKVHEMADAYRAADAEKYASEIRKMQDLWLDYEEKKAKAISDISGLLDAQEHEILLLEIANRKVVDPELQRKNAQQIVAINKKMQDEIHERADMLRDMGYKESSEYIRKLQEDWWKLQQENEQLMQEVFDDIVGTYENAVNYLKHLFDQAADNLDYSYMRENLQKQMDYYVKIQEEAANQLKYLAEKGYDIASDEAQAIVDVFYDAGQKIKEIARQIAADILDPFDDFIDLADKFDIWEYMDITKVDYLRDKLTALNKLFEDGTITARQYNEELKSLSYAIYDAQRELFQKQQDEIEKAAQETIKAYNEQIKLLNKQKDGINDYYDELINGYNKEIKAWEKRKEEVSDYYDTLIDNLRDVEKANERINKQVDYYNERQKIITNLEQAQARSGVEWREKEIEYQQNLIDLDEDWRRTLEEWSIEDQIAALENLKETTLKDIELSIQAIRDTITAAQEAKQAALDAIDAEIQGIQEMIETVEKETEEAVAAIEEQIKDMSRTIAESIKNGVEDGLVDSKEELDKALVDGTNALLGFIDSNGKAFEDGVKEASTNSYAIYTADFLEPVSDSLTEVAGTMKDALAVGASEGAKEALSAFRTGFIEPLKSELSSLMKQINSAKSSIASAAIPGSSGGSSGSKSVTSNSSSSKTSPTTSAGATSSIPSFKDFHEANTPGTWEKFKNPTQVFITNYNNTLDTAANRTAQTLRNILG